MKCSKIINRNIRTYMYMYMYILIDFLNENNKESNLNPLKKY